MLKIDKETAEALDLGKNIGLIIKQAVFLVISLVFVGWVIMPIRDTLTVFTAYFPQLVADVAAVKQAVNKMGDCSGKGRVAQAVGQ